jgi:hypothetical protein
VDPDVTSPAVAAVHVPWDPKDRVQPVNARPQVLYLGIGGGQAKGATDDVKVMESARQISRLLVHAFNVVEQHMRERFNAHRWPSSAAVESPVIRPDTPVWQDIINLAEVAGAALAWSWPSNTILTRPSPQQWKGSVPKETHQGRIYKALGYRSRVHGKGRGAYCVPILDTGGAGSFITTHVERNFGNTLEDTWTLADTPWADLGDAIGLALWAAEVTWPR